MKRRALFGLLAGGVTSGCLRLEQTDGTATGRPTGRTTGAPTTTGTTRRTTNVDRTDTTAEPTDTESAEPTDTGTENGADGDGPSLAPTWTHPTDPVTGIWTHDGAIYTSDENRLRKYDPDGTQRFRTRSFPGDTYSQCAAFGASTAAVAVEATSSATAAAKLVAYDASTGATRWTHTAPEDGEHAAASDVAIGTDTVAVATGSAGTCSDTTERITALDESTGDVRWTVDVDGECVNGLHVVSNALLVTTTDRVGVLALESGDRENTREQYYGFGRFTAASDVLYGGYDTVEARSTPDLVRQWNHSMPAELTTETAPLVTDDTAVAGTENGDVVAIERANGERRWRATMPGEITELARSNDHIWAGDRDGTVAAFDPGSGEGLARLDADSPGSRPLGIADDTLLVEGQAYRIEGR